MHEDGFEPESIMDRLARRLLIGEIRFANKRSRQFTTYHERPKFARHIGTWVDPDTPQENVAIAMQGPVMADDDFTLETLKLYARRAPRCRLILSTWSDTSPSLLAQIASLGVEIVFSEKPAQAGLFNVNMQLVGAAIGVRRAAERGAEWILKTRTDQRLYEPNALSFLVAVAKSFPPGSSANQRHRIVGVGFGTLKFAPYHVTDQTVFGHADDMLTYWTPPLRDTRPPTHWPTAQSELFAKVPIGELCRFGAAESYIASEFLHKMGRPLTWTLEDTWAAYRDCFCFVDAAATGFFWAKGQSYSLREHVNGYDIVSNRLEVGFREWMLLYSGALPVEAARRYEATLATCFNGAVVKTASV